jgi:hypothetical protein
MNEWQELAIALEEQGLTNSEITQAIRERGILADIPRRKAYDRVRKYLTRRKAKKPTEATTKPVVVQNYEPIAYDAKWSGDKVIRFALIGDTHINSKYTQLTHLHNFYEVCKREGIDTVYHTGDIDDGDQMRVGHQYELYKVGSDDHVNEIVRVYPKIDGITTKFICGNHDASIYKHCGHDIGVQIAAQRDDMVYLGRDCSVINLTPNCTLELRHPWDGTSYALSYKMQKIIDTMDSYNKPNILAVGHYHKMEQIYYKNVFAFQTACFQSATPFTVGKGLSVSMGGWIIEVTVHDDGTIDNLVAKFVPYSDFIKNDYLNFVNT